MKILVFAASLRKASFNRKLAMQVTEILKTISGIEIDHADYLDFEMPIYNGDVEESTGVPAGAKELVRRVQAAQAIIISTPEYNGSIPGTLKNAIDWASRIKPNPFQGKPLLLVGASPGGLGAVRGLWHTRVPFEVLGCYVYPEMFGLSAAHEAFDENSKLKDPKKFDQLNKLIQSYMGLLNKTTKP